MHHFAFWKTNLPFLSVCVGTVVLPKVPWRREDLCQFVIRHKLPNFMKYQITNWPSVRFPAWKWDCNIWASIRITERARQTQLPTAELARLCHFTPCYSSDTRQGQRTSQTFPIYSWSIYIFTGLDLFVHATNLKSVSDFLHWTCELTLYWLLQGNVCISALRSEFMVRRQNISTATGFEV